LITNIVIRIY